MGGLASLAKKDKRKMANRNQGVGSDTENRWIGNARGWALAEKSLISTVATRRLARPKTNALFQNPMFRIAPVGAHGVPVPTRYRMRAAEPCDAVIGKSTAFLPPNSRGPERALPLGRGLRARTSRNRCPGRRGTHRKQRGVPANSSNGSRPIGTTGLESLAASQA